MKAFHESRRGAPPPTAQAQQPGSIPSGAVGGFSGPAAGGVAPPALANSGLKLPTGAVITRPTNSSTQSAPAVPNMNNIKISKMGGGLAAKRGLNRGMKLSDASGPSPESQTNGDTGTNSGGEAAQAGSMFNKYSEYVDTATGTLRFKGKATIHGSGIDFSSGSSFNISLDEVDTIDELGKGNYGTVYQVRHSRPKIRRPGLGLAGNKAPPSIASPIEPESPQNGKGSRNTTGLIMAMKEIRLELDDAKFAQIIMELDILHRCLSPFIVDFYGAFFQEGAVYICMEFMDGGSIDKIYGDGIPENVLRKITLSTVMGLKSLKDDHNIIHRDVKPTNILVNSRGQVKICDFGVSGNLVASIAKTNIGCQSYMAPERIASGGVAQAGANNPGGTYSVQSDIWSLGLSIIECAMGRYPYPPETYNNIFSQLSVSIHLSSSLFCPLSDRTMLIVPCKQAIVDGDPPDLPSTGYSDLARDFVKQCLNKVPKMRPAYAMLLRHPWLAELMKPPTIAEDAEAEANAEAGGALGLESTAAVTTAAEAVDALGNLSLAEGREVDTADREVARWVLGALEKKRLGKVKGAKKPALHAAPLNAVPNSPEGQAAAAATA